MHTTKSGVTDYAAEDEMDAIQYIKDLLSYMPQNNMEDPPLAPCDDPITRKAPELNDIIPDNPNAAYDMKKVITTTADDGVFFEIKQNFAPNILIGFARYGGKAVITSYSIHYTKLYDSKNTPSSAVVVMTFFIS